MKYYKYLFILSLLLIVGCGEKKYSCTYTTSNLLANKVYSEIIIDQKDDKPWFINIKNIIEYKDEHLNLIDDEYYTLLEEQYKYDYDESGYDFKITRTDKGAIIDISADVNELEYKKILISNNREINLDVTTDEFIESLKTEGYTCIFK